MTDPHDAAAAERDLERAAKAHERVKRTYEQKRADLRHAVVVAVRVGVSKSRAARISGYSREYVKRICEEQDS